MTPVSMITRTGTGVALCQCSVDASMESMLIFLSTGTSDPQLWQYCKNITTLTANCGTSAISGVTNKDLVSSNYGQLKPLTQFII